MLRIWAEIEDRIESSRSPIGDDDDWHKKETTTIPTDWFLCSHCFHWMQASVLDVVTALAQIARHSQVLQLTNQTNQDTSKLHCNVQKLFFWRILNFHE